MLIKKIIVRNFPLLGDLELNLQSEDTRQAGTIDYNNHKYCACSIMFYEKLLNVNGWELLMLTLNSIGAKFDESPILKFFKSRASYVWIDFSDEEIDYHYRIKLNEDGFIDEALYEMNDGISTPLQMNEVRRTDVSSLPYATILFFSNIMYHSYQHLDTYSRLEKAESIKQNLDLNKFLHTEYSEYRAGMIELMGMLGHTIIDIHLQGHEFQFYRTMPQGDYTTIAGESNSFINAFFLSGVLLNNMFRPGILMLSDLGRFSVRQIRAIVLMFGSNKFNHQDSQLLMTLPNKYKILDHMQEVSCFTKEYLSLTQKSST